MNAKDLECSIINRHYNYLLSIFPSANRNILIMKCKELGPDEKAFEIFVSQLLDDPSPLKTEIDEEFVLPGDLMKYEQMNVEDFLKSLRTKDPFTYFERLNKSKQHKEQMLQYLKDRYLYYPVEFIASIATENKYNLLQIEQKIAKSPVDKMSNERVDSGLKFNSPLCINFVNEVRFVENYKQIEEYLRLREEMRQFQKNEGNTLQCECCWADDVLESEIISCSEGHIFCDTCVQKDATERFGQGNLTFPCLSHCAGFIPLHSVKTVISSTFYEKLCAKIQENEIKMANIPGIEFCPFCEYAVIPDKNDQHYFCLQCRQRICRQCKRADHTPLTCQENEQEGNENKIARLLMEENASNIILRKCSVCKHTYVKNGGCNVITCKCGTKLCYLCSSVLNPTKPYEHRCPTTAN